MLKTFMGSFLMMILLYQNFFHFEKRGLGFLSQYPCQFAIITFYLLDILGKIWPDH